MKALILAGGHATRLWPVTKDKPKPLLPLGGKPILEYILDELEAIGSIDKIYITTNEKFDKIFKKYLSEKNSDKYELIIEKQKSEEEKLGAIGGIINALNQKEEDDYLIIGGDNYYTFSIKDFIRFSLEKNSITNACFEVKSLEEAKNYGIIEFNEEKRITNFQEKPKEPPSKMASTACYFFPKEKLKTFDEYVKYWSDKLPKKEYLDETGRFLQWAVESCDLYAYPFTGKWVDVGTLEGYLRAEKELREENIIKTKTMNSKIGNNVTILEKCQIENSEIENSIIFENCKIKNSIVKNSIIGDKTEIENLDLRNGLVKGL